MRLTHQKTKTCNLFTMVLCELCHLDHQLKSCPTLCNYQIIDSSSEPCLAEISLPSWLELEKCSDKEFDKIQVKTKVFIKGHSKLGPLLAPISSDLTKSNKFSLHIMLNNGRLLFVDCANPHESNWLSLIPSSNQCFNLIACQCEEKIFYVSLRDLKPGEQLIVWYASFYTFPTVLTDNSDYFQPKNTENKIIISKDASNLNCRNIVNLSKISVENNQVVFTHLTNSNLEQNKFKETSQTIVKKKSEVNYSLEILDNDENMFESVVIGVDKQSKDEISHKLLSKTSKNPHNVSLQDKLENLTPRSLGARAPQSTWNCAYCDESFSHVINFANHLKNHILWLMGKKYSCKYCKRSFESEKILRRHENVNHYNGIDSEKVFEEPIFDDQKNENSDPIALNQCKKALPTKHIDPSYPCQICNKEFSSPQYLLRHLCKHTADYACSRCYKAFARKESLLKHQCLQSGRINKLVCKHCSKIFYNETLLKRHEERHQNNIKCDYCDKRFMSNITKKRHIPLCNLAPPEEKLNCIKCNKNFTTKAQLRAHMKTHNQALKCAFCPRIFKSQSYLVKHEAFCKQISSIRTTGHVKCSECNEEFSSEKDFRLHHQTHTHPYQCYACKQCFTNLITYEVHVCSEDRECEECGSTFSSIKSLNQHLLLHGSPKFSCSRCSQVFFWKRSFTSHKCQLLTNSTEAENNLPERIKCSFCSSTFAEIKNLKKHLASVHGNESTHIYECKDCNKTFARQDQLTDHELSHAPPTLPCQVCQKLFKSQRTLQVHSRTHFDNVRFSCRYCNKEFNQKCNLIKHELSHKPVGVICCHHCGAQCSSKEDLESHLLTHTHQLPQDNIQPFIPDQTNHDKLDPIQVDDNNFDTIGVIEYVTEVPMETVEETHSQFTSIESTVPNIEHDEKT